MPRTEAKAKAPQATEPKFDYDFSSWCRSFTYLGGCYTKTHGVVDLYYIVLYIVEKPNPWIPNITRAQFIGVYKGDPEKDDGPSTCIHMDISKETLGYITKFERGLFDPARGVTDESADIIRERWWAAAHARRRCIERGILAAPKPRKGEQHGEQP